LLPDPRWSVEQFTATIGTTLIHGVSASGTESAFKRTDKRAAVIGMQINAAAFTIRAHVERH
jgi:hypothetical protein